MAFIGWGLGTIYKPRARGATLSLGPAGRVFTPDIAIDFGGPAAWENPDALRTAFAAIHGKYKAVSEQNDSVNHLVRISAPSILPALVTRDDRASTRYIESFAVTIRNPNTRRAYPSRSRRLRGGGNRLRHVPILLIH
jgi:hypothetical protein